MSDYLLGNRDVRIYLDHNRPQSGLVLTSELDIDSHSTNEPPMPPPMAALASCINAVLILIFTCHYERSSLYSQ